MVLKALATVLMLVISNIFMTCAWYGNLKLQDMKVLDHPKLIVVILVSWALAFFEYSVMIPANRMGYSGTGGPFSLVQLKVIQEVVTLLVFTVFAMLLFKGEQFHWNHAASFACLVAAVYFAFK